ncbi:hypothetical protein CGSHi6P18H1_05281 [Haemophilus influenzae 6P18H1]|nr:hypothetical protein CGSHi6P18H1_05281 [Haemophilus influenzae 6P18H1]
MKNLGFSKKNGDFYLQTLPHKGGQIGLKKPPFIKIEGSPPLFEKKKFFKK